MIRPLAVNAKLFHDQTMDRQSGQTNQTSVCNDFNSTHWESPIHSHVDPGCSHGHAPDDRSLARTLIAVCVLLVILLLPVTVATVKQCLCPQCVAMDNINNHAFDGDTVAMADDEQGQTRHDAEMSVPQPAEKETNCHDALSTSIAVPE